MKYDISTLKSYNILGIKVHPLTVDQLHNLIKEFVKENQKMVIANVNIHAINLAYKTHWLKNFLNDSGIVFCDGAGVILGAKILGFKIPTRITYADWMWKLADFCESNSISLFFLGAKNGVARKAADRIKQKYPEIKILGTHHGYFQKMQLSTENTHVINLINQAKPDVLIVGFGMPLQERWLLENWGNLNVKIALTGGAVFDYVSGELRRAPTWMTDHDFEWLGRMLIEPNRLWKRYVIGNPVFLWRVIMQRLGIISVGE